MFCLHIMSLYYMSVWSVSRSEWGIRALQLELWKAVSLTRVLGIKPVSSTKTSMLSCWVILQPLHYTFKKQIYLIFAYVCVFMCMYVMCTCVSCRGSKRALAPLELYLWAARYERWEPKPNPLQEQNLFLFTKSSLKPLISPLKIKSRVSKNMT